jgi:hypothetical protein
MKNFMLLPAAKSNQADENDNDDELEEPKEAFSDCERGIFFDDIFKTYFNSFYL